jgi:DNA-binding transcriptional MerR regulator
MFTVGRLADLAGVNVETVRYYERRGLLPAPPRTEAGYRRYGEDDVWRLRFIRRAKDLGFTLSEVAELLGAGRPRSSAGVVEAAEAKLAELDAAARRIEGQRQALLGLLSVCGHDELGCLALATPCTTPEMADQPRSTPWP